MGRQGAEFLRKEAFALKVFFSCRLKNLEEVKRGRDDRWYTVHYPTSGSGIGPAEIVFRRKVRGAFYQKMELQHFPVDVQAISVQVSTDFDRSEITLKEDDQVVYNKSLDEALFLYLEFGSTGLASSRSRVKSSICLTGTEKKLSTHDEKKFTTSKKRSALIVV